MFFYVWLLSLSIITLRLDLIVCSDSALLLVCEQCSIVWGHHSVLSSYMSLEHLGYVPSSGYILKVELKESTGGWAATYYRKSSVTGPSQPLPLHWEDAVARC